MNLGSLINTLYDLRMRKEEFTKQLSELNQEIEALEFSIIKQMEDSGLDNVKATKGTAFRKVDLYPQVEDMAALVNWAAENGKPEILQRRVSSGVFKEIFDQTGEYPDGVKTYQKSVLNFRKAK